MSNVVRIENTAIAAMTEQEVMDVMQNSLYPGAKPASIKLVLGYCKAAGLDPMQKPVHIVPISVKQGDSYVMRDTVMPGIGLYRTQASRTGEYAGISEPEFGPTKKLAAVGPDFEYPEWCRVTVERVVQGVIRKFTANERWLENYATVKRDSTVPNAMWKRRPFAQLAKCAEAQALRKAFPELGSQPTADETIVPEEIAPERDMGKAEVVPADYPQARFDENLPKWKKLIEGGKKTAEQIIAMVSTVGPITDAQRKVLDAIKKVESAKSSPATAQQLADIRAAAEEATIGESGILKQFNLATLEGLAADLVEPIMAFLANPMGDA